MESRGWRLDRHISIVLIVTLFGQIIASVWSVAKFTSRVDNIESQQQRLELENVRQDSAIEGLRTMYIGTDKRLAVIEREITYISDNLKKDRYGNGR